MREIIEAESFKKAIEKLGGHRAVDEALEPIIEALYRNPYGFPFFQNDWVSFRYARTRALEFTPPLIVIFTIESNRNVILHHVEEDQDAH
jgi:hypothetical protein